MTADDTESTTTSWSAAARRAARSPAASARAAAFACCCWRPARTTLGSGSGCRSARAACCCPQRSLWRFHTEPQANLGNRRMFWPRGRVLGGSSTINGMLWVRGEPRRIRPLARPRQPRLGLRRRAAVSSSGWRPTPQGDGTRGKHGPVHIIQFGRNTLGDAFHKACIEAGVPATPDYNGAQYEGVGYLQSNTKRGLRFGGREAYLRPGARPAEPARAHRRARRPHPRREGPRRRRRLPRRRRAPFRPRHARGDRQRRRRAEPAATRAVRHRRQGAAGRPRHRLASRTCRVSARTAATICTRASRSSARGPSRSNDILDNPLRKAWMGLRYLVLRDGEMAACTATVHALAKTDPVARPARRQDPDAQPERRRSAPSDRAGARQVSGLRHRHVRVATGIEGLGAHPLGRSRRAAHDRGQLPGRRARSQDQHRRAAARAPHRRAAGAGKADRARGAAGPGSAVGRGAARAHRQARGHLLPPDRHLQDGQRRDGGGRPASCGCMASRVCASPTPPSCRPWCPPTPTRPRS